MNIRYLWRDENWKKGNNVNGYWIGNPEIDDRFEDLDSLCNIHGSYACVKETQKHVLLLVDLIGSYPLFYAVKEENIYISDDAKLIADSLRVGLKEDNVAEFRKTGYVTEKETLFQGVFGLNPGTCIEIDKNSGLISEREWFHLSYGLEGTEKTQEEKIREFDNCLTEVFSDLIDRLQGRTALIPLSGGLDSRLVAAYFKKLGYENVVCFSYGRKDNWESARSQKIAFYLGYSWLFEEYDADRWKGLMRSEEYFHFLDWSCRGRSIGCLQALPAILSIKKKYLVPDDAVVIPGHAMDFTMGSHISENLVKDKGEDLAGHILEIHYLLADKISDVGGVDKWRSALDTCSPVDAYMQWEYRNRQSKFIANDVRTYEYAGYAFELPLWDRRIQEFAMRLSLDDLIGRKFQREFTSQMIDPIVGLEGKNIEQPTLKTEGRFKSLMKKNILVKKYLECKDIRHRRFNDTNGFLSWLTDEEYQHYADQLGKKFILNSIEADDYIKRLRKETNG